ncbi:MAG TPA: ribonuclease E inhibitor RraB [Terriglobales bacterium]|nr:ribonuclease E inhibitor RraB [Terriglobales bacterium]
MDESTELGQIIARRVIKTPDGKALEVRMGLPQQVGEGPDSYCPIQISGSSDERILKVGGVDAFQAMQLAMKIVGTDLALLNNREYDGKLEWLDSGDPDLGFPLPDVLNLSELPASKRKKVTEAVDGHNARNRELKKSLLSKGVDLDEPCKCDFHFWANTQEGGSRLMKYLCFHFFEPEVLSPSLQPPDWNIELSHRIPPAVVLEERFTQYLVETAAIFDCVYDGWGTSV